MASQAEVQEPAAEDITRMYSGSADGAEVQSPPSHATLRVKIFRPILNDNQTVKFEWSSAPAT